MPGSHLLAIASRWFDERTVASVFEPLVADWQRESQETAGFGRIRVWICGAGALLVSMIASSPNVLLAPSPAGVTRRVITRLTIWTTVVTALNVIPFVSDLGRKVDITVAASLLVLLLPQAVALAFPFAITTVVDLIRTAPRPTREERIAAVRLAIVACALMLAVDGWVFPAANQQYRVTMTRVVMRDAFRRGPAPGRNELSVSQLTRHWLTPQLGDPINSDAAVAELSKRACLILAPVFFIWARWRALLLPRGHWYSAAPLILSAPLLIVCWYVLLAANRALADVLYMPRWSGLWLVFAVMVLSSIGLDRVRRRAAGLA